MGKALVIGDIMLDQYTFGKVQRLNPEGPNPLLSATMTENRIGGAGNVAANLVAMNVPTTLIGTVGDDNEAKILKDLMYRYNIEFIAILTAQPTISKKRFIEETYNQQMLRVDTEEKIVMTQEQETFILSEINRLKPDFLVISDYNKGTLSPTLIANINNLDIPCFVDTKPAKLSLYSNLYLLKPNFKEFKEMVISHMGDSTIVIQNIDSDIELYGKQLSNKLQSHIVVTRSEQGASLITKEGECLHIVTQAQDVFDVCGAGDTFLAALVSGLHKGMSLEDSVILANKASAVAVKTVGTAIVSDDKLI